MSYKGTILISVTDKTGLEKFAAVQKLGWRIISTGGTLAALQKHGIKCESVESITGFPEMMDGRLKTLHPKIHGGILADRFKPEHLKSAEEHGIPLIDIVVVNLYDFDKKPGIANIDIGGPAMIRGAAKNAAHIAVIVDPADYDTVINQLVDFDCTSKGLRESLAISAFEYTAQYDNAVATWMHAQRDEGKGIF